MQIPGETAAPLIKKTPGGGVECGGELGGRRRRPGRGRGRRGSLGRGREPAETCTETPERKGKLH